MQDVDFDFEATSPTDMEEEEETQETTPLQEAAAAAATAQEEESSAEVIPQTIDPQVSANKAKEYKFTVYKQGNLKKVLKADELHEYLSVKFPHLSRRDVLNATKAQVVAAAASKQQQRKRAPRKKAPIAAAPAAAQQQQSKKNVPLPGIRKRNPAPQSAKGKKATLSEAVAEGVSKAKKKRTAAPPAAAAPVSATAKILPRKTVQTVNRLKSAIEALQKDGLI